MAQESQGAELAKTLIRSVVRAFYEIREIIVIECLVIHTALRDDDLQALTTFTIKDLHKLCAKLTEDRLIATHHRNEIREGQQRAQSRTYYYIDYRQAIDAIKWRAYTISKDVQGATVVQTEKKEWFCPRCKSAWTQFEVLDKVGPEGFECHTCGAVLKHDPTRTEVGHEESTRLNTQFQFITDKLREIDTIRIPDNTFDVAYGNRREVIRDATNPVTASVPVEPGTKRPSAVHGLANTGPKSMTVSISTNEGPTEAEVAAEKARKEKIAKQNEMPAWMKASTVTGESFTSSGSAGDAGRLGVKTEEDDTKDKAAAQQEHHAEVDDLFARIRAQQAAEEAKKGAAGGADSGSEDEDDDDEGEFEDVVAVDGGPKTANGPSQSSLPAATATAPAAPPYSDHAPASPSKRALVDGLGNASTADERQVKKVKVEDPAPQIKAEAEVGSDEEDDLEFEDV